MVIRKFEDILAWQKAKELNIDDYVVFYGSCYDEKTIFQLMEMTNVVVSPGEVGLTAIHALCYGVPVITHDRFDKQMPEYEAIIEGKTGAFFEHDDAFNSLYEILKIWLFKKNKIQIKNDCFEVVDKYYNPYTQKKIFNTIV